ncbi:hypothetical protein D3C86_1913830 [compost metagenome]
MPGVSIGKNALVLNAIVGEGAVIKDGAIVGKPGSESISVIADKHIVGRHYPATIPVKLTNTRVNFG